MLSIKIPKENREVLILFYFSYNLFHVTGKKIKLITLLMQQIIVHLMPKSRLKSEVFAYERTIFESLHKKHGVKNVIFSKGEPLKDASLIEIFSQSGVDFFSYQNKQDLKQQLLTLAKNREIVYINTTSELLINISNEMKKALGQDVSDNVKIFRNKYLQRELLQKSKNTNGIKFFKGTIKDLSFASLKQHLWIPFILKPTNGIQSSGVVKISTAKDFSDYKFHYSYFHENCSDRGFSSDEIIAEEYIDGDMFSIDYFVSQKGDICISRPVEVKTGKYFGIDDFFNGAMLLGDDVEKKLAEYDLRKFIEQTVEVCGIRNTFIHHEFKVNRKWKLKTIEVNGRIWWGRLEMLHKSYGIDLYAFVLWKAQARKKLKYHFTKINIYAPYRGTLKWFNDELLEQISKLPWVYEIEEPFALVGKEVGLTKDGFIKVLTFKIAHNDITQIRADIAFIKKNYCDILKIEKEGHFTTFMHIIKTFTYKFPSRKNPKK